MREDLVIINLKYASSSESLVVLAYEELIKKVLVFNAEEQDLNMLGKNISSALGVKSVDSEVLKSATENLLSQKKLTKNNNKYSLKSSLKKQISEETQEQDKEKKRVIKKYFPGDLSEKQLKNWFNEAVVAFFGAYSDEIIASITRDKKLKIENPIPLKDLLADTVGSSGLVEHGDRLVSGFESFINSTEFDDTSYVTSLALALFSARLVAANISADPIALRELTSSSFVLDTNVLITIAIERKIDSDTLKSLGEVFTELDEKLYFLPPTRIEYLAAVQQRTEEISSLIDKYPFEVVIESRDDFVGALNSNSISDENAAKEFFGTLLEDFPPVLESAPLIEELIDKDIEKLLSRAEKNTKLISKLISLSKENSNHPKKQISAEHDAKLIYTVGELRKSGEKIWLLTTDRTLISYSEEVTSDSEKPFIMSFEALLNLLAIREAGTSVAGKKYGALLAQMIRNRCIPSKKAYRPEDLQYMVGVSEKVIELEPDKIKRIANAVFKQSQNSGEKRQDSAVRLAIDREFRASINKINKRADMLAQNLDAKEKELENERASKKQYIDVLTRKNIKRLQYKDSFIFVAQCTAIILVVMIILGLIYKVIADKSKVEYELILNLVLGILGSIPLLIKPFKGIKNKNKTRKRRAQFLVKKELK